VKKPKDPHYVILDLGYDTHSHMNMLVGRDEYRAEKGTWHTKWCSSWTEVLKCVEEHENDRV